MLFGTAVNFGGGGESRRKVVAKGLKAYILVVRTISSCRVKIDRFDRLFVSRVTIQ